MKNDMILNESNMQKLQPQNARYPHSTHQKCCKIVKKSLKNFKLGLTMCCSALFLETDLSIFLTRYLYIKE